MPEKEKLTRNKKIYSIWKKGKKGYKKIAEDFGLHYTTIAKIIYRFKKREEKLGR
jgi:DNA-binding PadR family transcriptional regulator